MNRSSKSRTRFVVQGAVIAAAYAALTIVLAPAASGIIQVRVAEALTILPFFTPAAIPGLFVGCVVANLCVGLPLDALFGSLATLAGALGSYYIGRACRGKYSSFLACLPPIIANTAVIPFVLAYIYCYEGGVAFFAVTIFAGELISAGLLGCLLLKALEKLNPDLWKI